MLGGENSDYEKLDFVFVCLMLGGLLVVFV